MSENNILVSDSSNVLSLTEDLASNEYPGRGLMLGVSLKEGLASGQIVKEALEAGLMLLTAKAKVRMLPPLTIFDEEINKGLDILEKVLSAHNQ